MLSHRVLKYYILLNLLCQAFFQILNKFFQFWCRLISDEKYYIQNITSCQHFFSSFCKIFNQILISFYNYMDYNKNIIVYFILQSIT